MKHLVKFPLDDGSTVIVEIDEPETGGTVRAGRGDTLATAKETLENALDNVLSVPKSLINKLHSSGITPDEMEISFGIKLTTTAGAVLASAALESNFAVTLRWQSKAEPIV